MDQRPNSGAKPPPPSSSNPFRFELPKTPPDLILPTKQPVRCFSCGSDYCCCKTMKNHRNFLDRKFTTAMIDQVNMDCAKARRSSIQELSLTLSSSSSSSWKRPPPPIMPVKPLFRPRTPSPPPPPPTLPTNSSDKRPFSQISTKKLAKLQNNRMQSQNQPQPPPRPRPPLLRTPSPPPPTESKDGKRTVVSLDPSTLEWVEKMSRQGPLAALNSWFGIEVPPSSPSARPPPKFTYGSKPATQNYTAVPPPPEAAFRSDENKKRFLGKTSTFSKPLTPTKPKDMGDDEGTSGGGGGMFSNSMKPGTSNAVDWYKSMVGSGIFGDKNVLSLVDDDIKVTPSTPPKFSYGSKPATQNYTAVPPPPAEAFRSDEKEKRFLGKNSTVKRPLTPPDTEGTGGGMISMSMKPETLEFVHKMGDSLLKALNLPCLGDKKPVTRDKPQESLLAFGFDEGDENFFGNKSNVNRPATPDNGGGTFSYSMKPEAVDFYRKMKSENFGALNFHSSMEEAVVPGSPPRSTHGTIYSFDENTLPPCGLDLTWHGRGTNDYEKSPAWSPTPSDGDKEEYNDKAKAPPPIPLGEIHLRPWYNKTNGYVIHSCLICSQGFAEIEELRKHESAKHGNRVTHGSLYCKHCDKAFVFSHQFDDHMDEHLYCRCCGEQLKQAVLNGFQRAAANMMRGFMRGGGNMGLENLCERCKERERRWRALKRRATETVSWEEEEEEEEYEDDEEEESFTDDSEEYDEDEEFDEEEEEYEEETGDEEEEEEETDEEMDDEDYEEEVDNKVHIVEMDQEEGVEEKKVENDIPENELGGVYVVEEVSDEEVEEEEEYEEVEEEEIEEEEDNEESMEDEETEEEETE